MNLKIKDTKFLLAGGCVRDKILGRQFKDRDYVVLTPLSFPELVEELEKQGVEIFQAKEEFLTIRARKDGEVFDIAFPRVDGNYSDGRRPDSVSLADSLKDDSNRRDFSINGMFMESEKTILDFHGGIEDINNKIIRCIGNPDERFSEDALRILRCIRFACQLDFHIEKNTLSSCVKNKQKLSQICSDRIREELNKSLQANAEKTIEYLFQMNLFEIIRHKGLRFLVFSGGK